MHWHATHPQPLPLSNGCVAALGNFDGVHAGHRALLDATALESRKLHLPLVALTFNPHPRTILRPDAPFHQLQTLPEKIAALHGAGAAGVAVIPFTPDLASLSPEAFISTYLHTWLNAKTVVVGENFHFGHKASGTPHTLQQSPLFATRVVPLLRDDVGPISSTRLRAARSSHNNS